MPLFMAVSGACFSWSIAKFSSMKDLAKNKVKRLLIPFLMVTTFVAVPLKYLSGYWKKSGTIIKDIFCGQYLLFGNSHLWFVVSLFLIFMIFYLLEKRGIKKNTVYWLMLTLISLVGSALLHFSMLFGDFFGIPGALKYLLFFAIGFSTFKYWNQVVPISIWQQSLSWLAFISTVVLCILFSKYFDLFLLKAIILFPINTLLALWGGVNMVFLSKTVLRFERVKTGVIYHFANRFNYELYLFSDPFNYVLIVWLMQYLGQSLFTEMLPPICAYMIRFAGTSLCAVVIIELIQWIKKPWIIKR